MGAYYEVEFQRRLQNDMNRVKMLREGEMVHSGKAQDDLSHGGSFTKVPRERGQELKASRYNYNQGKN